MEELPEHTGYWPKNPYELLGVDYGVDKKSLKRAYNKLVRKYKPDHFPDQFKRIREAYEIILMEAQYQFHSEPVADSVSGVEQSLTLPPDPGEKLWEQAVSGDKQHVLEELYKLASGSAENTLKYYWLAKISKVSQEKIFEVLKSSLSSQIDYRVIEVLKKEMLTSAKWTVSQECLDICTKISMTDSSALYDLVEIRWKALWVQNNYKLMCDDLEYLREKLPIINTDDWTLILLRLYKFICLSDFPGVKQILKKVQQEIESAPVNLGGYLQDLFDDYDYLLEVKKVLGRERKLPPKWRQIIIGYWAGVEAGYTQSLRDEMVKWAADPKKALDTFAKISKKNKTHIHSQIKRIVSIFAMENGSFPQIDYDSLQEARCVQFLSKKEELQYQAKRGDLLNFCLYQDVPPDVLHNFILQIKGDKYEWATAIAADLHQAVYMACKSMLSYSNY